MKQTPENHFSSSMLWAATMHLRCPTLSSLGLAAWKGEAEAFQQ
jgi:hypothetical protein